MNLYFRLIGVLISCLFKSRITNVRTVCKRGFHVLPTDLDTNLHMNNGRYLTLMDLGRLELVIRTGLLRAMIRRHAIPVLSSVKIRYRIPLHLFESYRLETKVLCWDEKWVYMQQRFVIAKGAKKGATAAIAILKAGFFDKKHKKTVPTDELINIIGIKMQSPDCPAYIHEWQKAETSLRNVTAREKKDA